MFSLSSHTLINLGIFLSIGTVGAIMPVKKPTSSHKQANYKNNKASSDTTLLREQKIEAGKVLRHIESKILSLEKKIHALKEEEERIQKQVDMQKTNLIKIFYHLKKISNGGSAVPILSSTSLSELIHVSIALRSLVPNLKKNNTFLNKNILSLKHLRHELLLEEGELIKEKQKYDREMKQFSKIVSQKPTTSLPLQSLSSPFSKEDLQSLLTINDLINYLSKKFNLVSAPQTSPQHYVIPHLGKPAIGTVVKTSSTGVIIKTPSKASIVAPLSGKIIFKDNFLDQGPFLIIGSNNFAVVLKNVVSTFCQIGEDVVKGQPIGSLLPNETTLELSVYFYNNHDLSNKSKSL